MSKETVYQVYNLALLQPKGLLEHYTFLKNLPDDGFVLRPQGYKNYRVLDIDFNPKSICRKKVVALLMEAGIIAEKISF